MTAVMEQMIDQPVAAGAPKRKGRSGSAKRQRTEQVKLNLLPGERAALERAAADEGLEAPACCRPSSSRDSRAISQPPPSDHRIPRHGQSSHQAEG